jgi:hypothetical protein
MFHGPGGHRHRRAGGVVFNATRIHHVATEMAVVFVI